MKKRNILSFILSIILILNSCSFARTNAQGNIEKQINSSEWSYCSSFGPDASSSTLKSAANSIASSGRFNEGTATAELNGNYRSETTSNVVKNADDDHGVWGATEKVWTEFYNASRGYDNDGAWAAGYKIEKISDDTDPGPGGTDPEPSCDHTYTSTTASHTCNKPSDQGSAVNYSSNQALTANIARSNSYTNPFIVTDKFDVFGDLHINRSSSQGEPTTHSQTCGAEITTTHRCTKCGDTYTTSTTCNQTYSYKVYPTPTYTFTRHSISSITFTGFTANLLSKNWPAKDSFSKTQWNVPEDFAEKTYTTTYQITSLIPSGLTQVTTANGKGLAKGTATVHCTCGETRTLDLYFNLAPVIDPEIPTGPHTLTARTDGGGLVGIAPNGATKLTDTAKKSVNDQSTVYAKEDTGYTFEGWYDGDTLVSKDKEFTFPMPGTDYTLVAKFNPVPKHKVIVYSDGNGTATVSHSTGENIHVTDKTNFKIELMVPDGEVLHFSATPDPGFNFELWAEYVGKNESNLNKPSSFDYTITRDMEIIVHFKTTTLSYHTLTVTHNGGGITRGGTKYAITGKQYPIWARPNVGYKFVRWEDPAVTTYTQIDTITMPNNDYTLTAIFEPNNGDGYYSVDIYSDGNGTATTTGISTTADNTYHIQLCVLGGTSVAITSDPDAYFNIDGWYEINDIGDELLLSTTANYNFTVNKNIILIVHFKPESGLPTAYRELRVTHREGGYAIGGTKYALIGNDYPIFAINDSRHEFKNWLEYNEDSRVKENIAQYDVISMPYCTDDYYELTATFEETDLGDLATIEVIGSGPGIVAIDEDPDPANPKTEDKIHAPVDSVHEIVAEPIPGVGEFYEWTDEEGNPIPGDPHNPKQTVSVTEDTIYIAHFTPVITDNVFDLSIESAGHGSVTPTGTIKAVAGYTYYITAKPNKNYRFDYWEDNILGVTDIPATTHYLMPERDVTLTAHFNGGSDPSRPDPTDEVASSYRLTIVADPAAGGNPKTTDGRTSGSYAPFTNITLNANTKSGYAFVGWYDDLYRLIGTNSSITITMPARDYKVTAAFKATSATTKESAFSLKSIRDIRWQKYFSPNGSYVDRHFTIPGYANSNTILLNAISLEDNSFSQYRQIVYGYAVESEIKTSGIPASENPGLKIDYTLTGVKNDGTTVNISESDFKTDVSKYLHLTFNYNTQNEEFLTSAKETKATSNGIEYSIITWDWIFYLPTNLQLNNGNFLYQEYKEITVKYNITVTKGGQSCYNYVEAINHVTDSSLSNWGGKVFTYRTRQDPDNPYSRYLTVLTDLEDNLTY